MRAAIVIVGVTLGVVAAPVVADLFWRKSAIRPRLTQLLPLNEELVFAHSRINPDGTLLVYSSEPDHGRHPWPGNQTLRVYDLRSNRTIYQDRGIDGYWSPDGQRLIYKAGLQDRYSVSVWDRRSGQVTRDIIPDTLGDYYSWGADGHINTVLTIDGWFITIDAENTVSAPTRIPECDGIGTGARPLISRDGRHVSVFVEDELVLRHLRDCSGIVKTGVVAAKADWSRDSRYLAFHTPKLRGQGYEIAVFDTATFTLRKLQLSGSGYFPSWTDDNAVVFRYEGADYSGFVRADDVLFAQKQVGLTPTYLQDNSKIVERWKPVLPAADEVVVLLWARWSAHTSEALTEFSAFDWPCAPATCATLAAYEPSSGFGSRSLFSSMFGGLQIVEAPWPALIAGGGANQSPTYLLFTNRCLSGRTLGTMSASELEAWVTAPRLPVATQKACVLDVTRNGGTTPEKKGDI